jgi:uncharacterized protein GlcG (DUF336 family)
MSITLKEAQAAIEATLAKADSMGVPVVVAVVDAGGHLIAQAKQDEAIITSIEVSYKKAQTAVFMKMDSHELAAITVPGQPLWGLGDTGCGSLVLFGGGFTVRRDGKVVGGIGVSGGSVDEDMEICKAGLALLAK